MLCARALTNGEALGTIFRGSGRLLVSSKVRLQLLSALSESKVLRDEQLKHLLTQTAAARQAARRWKSAARRAPEGQRGLRGG